MVTKFLTNLAQIIGNFLCYFEKPHSYVKTGVATSWVTLGNIWATFYSNIWSHWVEWKLSTLGVVIFRFVRIWARCRTPEFDLFVEPGVQKGKVLLTKRVADWSQSVILKKKPNFKIASVTENLTLSTHSFKLVWNVDQRRRCTAMTTTTTLMRRRNSAIVAAIHVY